MCGIAGFWGPPAPGDTDGLEAKALRMADAIAWRGPDDRGAWADAEAGIALGHRRLAVLDTSAAGHQPMCSPSGRYTLAYNGECYNFQALRRELETAGTQFTSDSDTEVLLAGFEGWGVEETLRRAVGMFALVVWDAEERTLLLARDRLGEKPLYYGVHGGVLLFASQPSALRAHAAFRPGVDQAALAEYVRLGYVPAPWSIYEGIRKLLPGTFVRIPVDRRTDPPAPTAYWSATEVARHGADGRGGADGEDSEKDDEAVLAELEDHLRDAVRGCLVSDVPVGVLLSGGIDSSLVAALAGLEGPVRTFTLGFHEAGYDEATHAAAVAEHLGTEHTQEVVTPEQAREVIPLLPRIYDEPFADSSQIPTYLVSRLARRSVTVCLSGDGGDELLGGYNRHVLLETWWPRITRVPLPVRRGLAAMLRLPRPGAWDAVARLMPERRRPGAPADKARKVATVLDAADAAEAYRRLTSLWDPEEVLADPPPPAANRPDPAWIGHTAAEAAMLVDARTYLPDDILVKTDRAAMAVSLEGRAPLLDPRVFEAAWRLAPHLRIHDGRGKVALRRVLERHVPARLLERPKQGFAVPIDAWLRGPLREWAESLLDEDRLRQEGHFDPGVVRRCWEEHLAGRRNRQHELWCVLMFQAWLEKNAHRISKETSDDDEQAEVRPVA